MSDIERAPVWKLVVASIFDFFSVFLIGGMLIGRATGQTTADGFELEGAPALVLFAIIVAYFVILRRYAGGTLWDRILRIQRPQPR